MAELVATVAARMIEVFARFEQERIAEEDAAKRRAQEERLWRERQRLEEHRENLDRIAMGRAMDLVRTAEWWRIRNDVLTFTAECEARWRDAGGTDLTEAQMQWLSWARDVADCLSPFSAGYPVPARDGPFDAHAVKIGDTYPMARSLPDPPSMQTHAAQRERRFERDFHGASAPYPFWLKHRGR